MRQFFASIWEVIEVVLIALITVFLIRTFVVQPFLVSGASMEPNFQNGNYLLIDEATYYFRKPERGEVTVFRYPNDPSSFFIKRIIGLPGETVIIQGNTVAIASTSTEESPVVLQEAYLPANTRTPGDTMVQLGEDEYFVLGDNRSNSFDSRNWGTLKRENIIGLVRLRIYPFSEFGTIPLPQYAENL